METGLPEDWLKLNRGDRAVAVVRDVIKNVDGNMATYSGDLVPVV